MNALLVGFGSAGKNYFRALVELGYKVSVYDPFLSNAKECIHIETDIRNFENKKFEISIFADWAQSRFKNMNKLLELNCSLGKIVFEKLLCSQTGDIRSFNRLVGKDNKVYTHLRWNILGLPEVVSKLQVKYGLGKLCGATCVGGNCCISVGGAHWLGFVINFAKLSSNLGDLKITTDIEIAYNSPRAKDIAVLSGLLTLSNSNFYSTFLFNKDSSIAPTFRILFEFGIVELQLSGEIQVFRNQFEESRLPWQYQAVQKIDELTLPAIDPFRKLITDVTDSFDTNGIHASLGLDVAKIMVAAANNTRYSGTVKNALAQISSGKEVNIT